MIPSCIPNELQDLTQIEEMLIARALPIMNVYVKPGGQRGFSGHCINLPQQVSELAQSLPRYPKHVSLLLVTMNGKDNAFKDVIVRRSKVQQALIWLIQNNPHYSNVTLNLDSLQSLPVNGVPDDLQSVETNETEFQSIETSTNTSDDSDEDQLINNETRTSSFLPHNEKEKLEKDAILSEIGTGKINWPTIEDKPLNEYTISGLATLAFPALFPDGKGDPTNPCLHREVPFTERIKHLLKFAETTVNGKFYFRFASHPRFSYWALNMIQRKRTMQQTAVFFKQNPGEAHFTLEELRNMANEKKSQLFMAKVSRYVANISGSSAYWYKLQQDLKSIIAFKGPPTIFFTLSSADMHWPELHQLFNSNIDDITAEERRMNVINNPHLVDWFFTKRVEQFVKHWLYNCLGAEWHRYRYEYQARGSIHCHGIAKLKSDPGLCDLTDKALKGFLAEKLSAETSIPDICMITDGKKASQQICKYVDTLMSTYNPCPPDSEIWIKPKIHPCKQRHECVADIDDDYTNLLNTVQRHTRCNTRYCLRYKQGVKDMQCRFNYPFDLCPQTKLVFEPVHRSDGKLPCFKARIVTKRNDTRLNNHQRIQLQGWRANCDIQVVIDQYACIEYLSKYAAKGEPKSPMLTETFDIVMKNTDDNSDAQKTMKKVAMRTLGQRDFSAQETIHLLFSLRLYSTTFNVLPVSLYGSRRVNPNQHNVSAPCTKDSLLDLYAKHLQYVKNFPDVKEMSLVEFITKYRLVKGKLVNQSSLIVPQVFPNYSPNPKGKFYSLFCKYQLLKYKPWSNNPNNAWNSEEPSDQTYINAWHEYLSSPEAVLHVPNWEEKLHDAIENTEIDNTDNISVVEDETS